MKFLQVTDVPEDAHPEVKEGKIVDIPVGSYIFWVSQRKGVSYAVSNVALLCEMTPDYIKPGNQKVRVISVSRSNIDMHVRDGAELQRYLAPRGGISLIFPNDRPMHYSQSAKALLCLREEIHQKIHPYELKLTGD